MIYLYFGILIGLLTTLVILGVRKLFQWVYIKGQTSGVRIVTEEIQRRLEQHENDNSKKQR